MATITADDGRVFHYTVYDEQAAAGSSIGGSMYTSPITSPITAPLRLITGGDIQHIRLTEKETEDLKFCNICKDGLARYYYDKEGYIYYAPGGDSLERFALRICNLSEDGLLHRLTFFFPKACIQCALENLKTVNGVDDYCDIMKGLRKVDVSTDMPFQKLYKNFYVVLKRPDWWYDRYFAFMEKYKGDKALGNKDFFEKTLRYLYEKPVKPGKPFIEMSFSSKLVHTINPHLPIWDEFVTGNIGIKKPLSGNDKEIQLRESIAAYNRLVSWYDLYRQTENAKELLDLFNNAFPNQQAQITDTNKIDLVLWQMR